MRVERSLLILLLTLCGFVLSAPAQGTLKLSGTLILADNTAGPSDKSLGSLTGSLKRIFGFKRYTRIGGGSTSISIPGNATMNLGQGFTVQISAQAGGRASLKFIKGGKAVGGGGVLAKGKPLLIGGISHGSGKAIVSIVAR